MFSGRFRGAIFALGVVGACLVFVAPAMARNAYVANNGDGTVSVLNLSTNTPAGTIPVGARPVDVAITPNGAFAYVTNSGADSVSVISTASNSVVATIPLAPGSIPRGIAIAPDGQTAWVANSGDGTVSVIFTDTNALSGGPIVLSSGVGSGPDGIAISPDGGSAFVAQNANDVAILSTATRAQIGMVADINGPSRIAIGPRGGRAFVTDNRAGSTTATAFNPANGAVIGGPIPVGATPSGIAIAPNGVFAYAAALGANTVTPIATSTNATSPAIGGFNAPAGVAIAPDSAQGYVANSGAGANNVSSFSTATNAITGAIATGATPTGLAIVPNQGPSASFLVTPQRRLARRRLTFQAGASSDPDGTVANYAWDWGDGKSAQGPQTRRVHRYVRPGTYTVTLTVTDDEGCSNEQVFTGQTASCNGTPSAVASTTIAVLDPNAPVLRLVGGKRQRVRGSVNVFALCPREACALRARGVVVTKMERRGRTVRGKRQLALSSAPLAATGWRKLSPRLRRGVRRAAIRALRSGGKATAHIRVIARNAAGQQKVRNRTVKLVFPRARQNRR
jgi:YVTN family beta-propeller protein